MDPANSSEWTQVSIPKDCLCVNLGDELEVLTNYLWRSTMHRVVRAGDLSVARQSLVFFQQLNPDTLVRAIP